MAATLKHIRTFRRTGQADILLGWATRTAQSDALYQWNSSTGWTFIAALTGTNLTYSSVVWKNRVYWVDGKNALQAWDGSAICTLSAQAPVGQYIVVYQARLVIGGDARLIPSEVSEVNTNRNLVVYSEALDDSQWSPNNFIQCDIVGDGHSISGLGVVSAGTSDQGAQQTLAVFHPHATLIHQGVLGSGEVQLNIVSKVRGCPGYNTIANTPFGLMYLASNQEGGTQPTVCLLAPGNSGEPAEVGLPISTNIAAMTTDAMRVQSAAIFHDGMYKLSFDGLATGTNNTYEWWLDLRQTAFPQENNWYGPHTGDNILQYEIFGGNLIAAELGTSRVWKVDVTGLYGSMTASGTPRTSTMIWPRLRIGNQKKGSLDAYGISGQLAASAVLTGSVDIDRGTYTIADTFTAPASLPANTPMYALIRP